MRITFHGAARTVTGSMHLIEVNGSRLLLECGLFQGPRKDTYERNRNMPFDAHKIDAVILSHAHIDHSGNLPHLVKNGFEGKVYATPATAFLTDVMLLDSGHIQESDAVFVNKHRSRRGQPPIEPLYTKEDAARVKDHLQGIPYNTDFEPVNGITARLVDAGHILGSAAVVLVIQEKGKKIRLWFSGDIGRRQLPIIRDPILPDQADILVMESTYGDKVHRDPEEAYAEFRDVVKKTVNRGGKVIIPAFAVGRTQEIVFVLNQMYVAGEVPRVPVFVDSPLAINATEVFQQFPDCYDRETLEFQRVEQHPALQFKSLTYTRSAEDSKALNFRDEPMIIIAASGMAESGRILHHLKNNIGDSKNTICIVSWQSPGTLGRRLADREDYVKIFGETYHRRAEVATIGGLSAHAGQDLLVEYALRVKNKAKGIYLVHGEDRGAMPLMEKLGEAGISPVHYPDAHASVEI
jgi:metallo-beta-lactamase family protein